MNSETPTEEIQPPVIFSNKKDDVNNESITINIKDQTGKELPKL